MTIKTMKTPVIGLGAGGHAKVIIEILQKNQAYKVVGLLDINLALKGQKILGVPILGNDEQLPHLIQTGLKHAFIGLGSTGNIKPRQKLYEFALAQKMILINAIHPQAIISPSAILGQGVTIMAGAIINAQSQLGDNVIVNTGATVEHDCVLGHHVHIATGAKLASTVKIGDGSHIGAGATVKQCINIGNNAIIGAGATVVKDVPAYITVVGVPARPLKKF